MELRSRRPQLLDQVLFQLDEGKFQQLVDLLDSPPDENPGLARLMAVNAPWQTEKT